MMGLFLEEVEAGMHFDLGSYTFTPEGIRKFSTQFVPVGFHMDTALAEKGLFGGQVAAGWHICCGWMACFVEKNATERARVQAEGNALPEIGPSAGMHTLRWPSPVNVGDVISYRVAFKEKRLLKSRPQWGMVSIEAHGAKRDGTAVMSFGGKVMVERRG